jgi:nicotinate-nucleotide adenylyltransferase
MLNLALFGTSADPPTLGHLAILNYLSDQYDRVAIWAADNPFKPDQTPLDHRNRMLELLVHSLLSNQVSVERDLSHQRTILSIQKAQERWPGANFTLVIGADLVDQLPKWYQVEAILQAVKLLVMPRSGYELTQKSLQGLTQLGAHYQIAPFTPPPISSTEYRRQGQNQACITASVAAYIQQHNLYP